MNFMEKLEESYIANRKTWLKSLTGGNVTAEMAEDIVSLAAVNALEHKDSYKDSEDFDAWFYGIVSKARIDIINDERSGGMVGRSV